MLVNKLMWFSSKDASEDTLRDLNERMADFYGKMAKRQAYQVMIDEAHTASGDPVSKLSSMIADYIIDKKFYNILEIGCGSGKIFRQLRLKGYSGKYTGIEMAAPVIENNRLNLPEATWEVGSVYEYCTGQATFDCCIAFFVLEHLIYPEKALQKMLGSLPPGGQLLLVFPDFSYSGIFPSQKVGLRYGKGSKEKLREGKIADAVISYVEARILAYRLKKVNRYYGRFVVNVNPFCLSSECTALIPDIDAIYVSNRVEIEQWATDAGYEVTYPCGHTDSLALNPFMTIRRIL